MALTFIGLNTNHAAVQNWLYALGDHKLRMHKSLATVTNEMVMRGRVFAPESALKIPPSIRVQDAEIDYEKEKLTKAVEKLSQSLVIEPAIDCFTPQIERLEGVKHAIVRANR